MKIFKVNEYLTLKLENNTTIIYVKDQRFIQCKYLFLDFPKEKIKEFNDIESIDEASERLDKSLEPNPFWGVNPKYKYKLKYDKLNVIGWYREELISYFKNKIQ